MSGPVDPATGKTLSIEAIQRVLFICHPVHVFAIPPLTSMKGYTAADWTVPDPNNNDQTRQIFTARLRILETAIPAPLPPSNNPRRPAPPPLAPTASEPLEKVKTDILLEDPSTGNLFAAAPYNDPGVVEHALDSSRFFALRVVGDGGRKAVLGIGFEDRSEAFDFGVTLQEARKVLGFTQSADGAQNVTSAAGGRGERRAVGRGGGLGGGTGILTKQAPEKPPDYSLKPGQTISINIGRKRPESRPEDAWSPATAEMEDHKALFSIPPPPPPGSSATIGVESTSSAGFPLIPPPPRTERRRRPASFIKEHDTESLTFSNSSKNENADDGDFGDFQ